MTVSTRRRSYVRRRLCTVLIALATSTLLPPPAFAQGLTGTLTGTVKDARGGSLAGARVRLSSPVMIGGPKLVTTDSKGKLRFSGLTPGTYALEVELQSFLPARETELQIVGGAPRDITVVMALARVETSIVVESSSRIVARDSGVSTRFGPDTLSSIPMRRASLHDLLKGAPGISPTTPSGGTTLVSAFGSGVDQNLFLLDGTNISATSNGMARADPGIDFVQELQIQSIGASAEYGNAQGAVVNIITKSGTNRFQYAGAYYAQAARLTSQPLRTPDSSGHFVSGYERALYRDVVSSLGGPVVRDRLWFFGGFQNVRDHDSQPGTDPFYPRRFDQDKIFVKLTWRLAPGWQLDQSFHDEFWSNAERPTFTRPFQATQRLDASVPAINFGHLIHARSPNTLWDISAGRFVFSQTTSPSSGDRTIPNRVDQPGDLWSGAPQQIGGVRQVRTTAKATVTHYMLGLLGADHELKFGLQADRGEHRSLIVLPTGARSTYTQGVLTQTVLQPPANSGGKFITAGAFVSDSLTPWEPVVIMAGVRFDYLIGISPDVHVLDADGRDTGAIVSGKGMQYEWNVVSPRLGATIKLDGDGRTMLRMSYGRFSQGVLTGEISPVHPGAATTTTTEFVNGVAGTPVDFSPTKNVRIDRNTRAPRTDEYSIGVDRELGNRLAITAAYVRKNGDNFIGWVDEGGVYDDVSSSPLPDGRSLTVKKVQSKLARNYVLTNPPDYSLTYNGLVMTVEKRRSRGWQAFGSYTFSRAYGVQPSGGTTAEGAQVSTVGAPPVAFSAPVTFGRDPNDLINAGGRLANDRPHMFRVMGSIDIPRTGLVLAANLQCLSGKPWAATALINPNDSQRRVLLEPRGTRRLPSQTLLDVRVSKTMRLSGLGRVEFILDILNVLNDTAAEGIASDIQFVGNAPNPSFGQGNVFMDPRRAMLSVKFSLGR